MRSWKRLRSGWKPPRANSHEMSPATPSHRPGSIQPKAGEDSEFFSSTFVSFIHESETMMRRAFGILGAAALLIGPLRTASAADPPAVAIASKMAGVADDLNRKETGAPVQAEQKTIVRDLDELIASLEKECQACRGGIKRNRPRSGMRDSMISAGTGGIGTLGNPTDNGKDWGQLSGRERDRILQSMSEGFPPEYRTVLERYYRRLAEEKKPAPPSGELPRAKDAEAQPGADDTP